MIFEDIFRDRKFWHKFMALSLPITLQQLMLSLVAAGDAFMLGRLTQDAMAAVSLATQIQFVQNLFLGAIAAGVAMVGAQYWGKNDKKIIGKLFCLSIQMSLLISLPFFIGCFFFPAKLMKLFASDSILIHNGAGYLRIASWSYLFCCISQCYLAMMRVSENAIRSAVISSVAVILNIIFNALFIFGVGCFPELGIAGAACATVMARLIEMFWCIFATRKQGFMQVRLKNLFSGSWQLFVDFWKYTLPILGAYLLWGVGFTSYTAIMGQLGRDSAAANSIAAVVRDILCCLANGIAGGCAILIGNELGAGKLKQGRIYGNRIMKLSILIGVACTVVILCSIPFISRCFELTPMALHYMKGMFVIMAFYMIGRSICTILINGIFTAGGDTFFDVCSLFIFMWCIALPCAFLCAFYFHFPVLLVYACTCMDEVCKVPWVFRHHFKYQWVRNITR